MCLRAPEHAAPLHHEHQDEPGGPSAPEPGEHQPEDPQAARVRDRAGDEAGAAEPGSRAGSRGRRLLQNPRPSSARRTPGAAELNVGRAAEEDPGAGAEDRDLREHHLRPEPRGGEVLHLPRGE